MKGETMRFRVLKVLLAVSMIAQAAPGQTIEERVTRVEAQVAELWALSDLQAERRSGVPVELVGQAPLDAVELVGFLVEAGVFEIAMKLVDIRHRMVARRFNAQMSSKGNCVVSER